MQTNCLSAAKVTTKPHSVYWHQELRLSNVACIYSLLKDLFKLHNLKRIFMLIYLMFLLIFYFKIHIYVYYNILLLD